MFIYPKGIKSYPDLNFFQKIIFKFKNRKVLKQLKQLCKNQSKMEFMPRLDDSYNNYIKKFFENNTFTLSSEE